MSLKTLIRERFVEKISFRTKWNFGDVIAVLDETLNEISPLEFETPGTPMLSPVTTGVMTDQPRPYPQKLSGPTVTVREVTPEEAEEIVKQMQAQAQAQVDAMNIDLSEPQENADIVARIKQHTEENRGNTQNHDVG